MSLNNIANNHVQPMSCRPVFKILIIVCNQTEHNYSNTSSQIDNKIWLFLI